MVREDYPRICCLPLIVNSWRGIRLSIVLTVHSFSTSMDMCPLTMILTRGQKIRQLVEEEKEDELRLDGKVIDAENTVTKPRRRRLLRLETENVIRTF